ncbi:hypothetical protein CPC16_002767, partial [Podila verticillata]
SSTSCKCSRRYSQSRGSPSAPWHKRAVSVSTLTGKRWHSEHQDWRPQHRAFVIDSY